MVFNYTVKTQMNGIAWELLIMSEDLLIYHIHPNIKSIWVVDCQKNDAFCTSTLEIGNFRFRFKFRFRSITN